ncbi:MAG TPA: HAF repeat-containing protein [Candidatus Dormibacteraeota bacterium]|nr:HAF repeat-containing protein [Candidatus Dormibacteraeota bacterium]
MKALARGFTFVGMVLMMASTLCSAQTSYSITDLGTINTNGYSVAKSVNATAQVTGAAGTNNSNLSEVFFYSNGAMSSLGTLGGSSGVGNGINASGQVAGYSQNSQGTYRAFLSTGGTLTDIGDLGGGSAVAYAINDFGQVVGSAVTAKGENHPFLYKNGKMTDLGTLGSKNNNWWNSAQGVNNSGAVTGTSYDAQGNFFGFVWKNGKMTKMGTLGGSWSQGYAINNKGQVTGLAYTKNGSAHGFIANCGSCALHDLGTITGSTSTVWGFAINDSGVVVGQTTFQGTYHAFVYSGGKMKDLNSMIPAGSGWVLTEANGINAVGQIVGMGTINGQQHGYLLTPQ